MMKHLHYIFAIVICLLLSSNLFAQEEGPVFTPDMTFHACGGHEFTLNPATEIYASEISEIDNLSDYTQEFTYEAITEQCNATSCDSECVGFEQHYSDTSTTVSVHYIVTLRLYKDYISVYEYIKRIEVIVTPQPQLKFGTNPIN